MILGDTKAICRDDIINVLLNVSKLGPKTRIISEKMGTSTLMIHLKPLVFQAGTAENVSLS